MTDELDAALAAYLGRSPPPRASAGWGKALVSGALSAMLTVATGAWWARGVIADLQRDIATITVEVHYLREHIDSVQSTAIEAKRTGDEAKAMMFAMKGGYPGKAP